MIEIFSWFASITSIVGIALSTRKNIICWYFFLVGSMLWLIISINKYDIPQMLLWISFICFNFYGFYSWRKDEKKTN